MPTLGEIKTRVLSAEDLAFDDDAQSQVAEWVMLGLEDCYQALRPWWMTRSAKITITARPVDDIDCSRAELPPSFLGMQALIPWDGGCPLEPISPEDLARWLQAGGGPRAYFLDGGYVTVLPRQTAETSYRATYWSRFEPPVTDQDTNLLTERAWNAIVYASLRHAAIWRADDAGLQRYQAAFAAMVQTINADAYSARAGSGWVMRRAR